MNKVHVIVNPHSARGQTGRRWETIRSALRLHFREFKFSFTEKPRQATEIARELLLDGFDLLIGVGGDGTLNEISSGFFHPQSGQAINKRRRGGHHPLGDGFRLHPLHEGPPRLRPVGRAHQERQRAAGSTSGKHHLRRGQQRPRDPVFRQRGRFRPGSGGDPQHLRASNPRTAAPSPTTAACWPR